MRLDGSPRIVAPLRPRSEAGRCSIGSPTALLEKMTMIKTFIRRFIRDESGAALAEYEIGRAHV